MYQRKNNDLQNMHIKRNPGEDNAREFRNYINVAKMKSWNVGLNSWLAEMSVVEQGLHI
jgi:hypothetical protein